MNGGLRPPAFSPHRRRFLTAAAAAAGGLALGAPRLFADAGEGLVLRAAPATASLADGYDIPVWAFNGRVPGPEIRVRQGEWVRVRLENGLEQESTIHWHGIRLNNAMDGVPDLTQAPVAAGDGFDYAFVAPDAGTFWYHSHRFSPEQVGRGLHGLLIVEESSPYPVDREISLVIDDWRLNNQGEIDPSFGNMHDVSHGGRLGNWITVNGVSAPDLKAERGERLRLRLANTANARIMTVRFAGQPVWAIALDGQPIAPLSLEDGKVTLAPGQRTDLVVDIVSDPGTRAPIEFVDDRGVFPIAHFAVGETAARTPRDTPPPGLPKNPLASDFDTQNGLAAQLSMSGGAMGNMRSARYEGREMAIGELVEHGMVWAMNGVAGMTEAQLFSAARGRTVLLDITNDNRWPHAMHIHGHHFRVIERNGEALPDSPWRDTTLVYGFDHIRLAFVADNPGDWLIHCHMLEHAAGGMMTWFQVT